MSHDVEARSSAAPYPCACSEVVFAHPVLIPGEMSRRTRTMRDADMTATVRGIEVAGHVYPWPTVERWRP